MRVPIHRIKGYIRHLKQLAFSRFRTDENANKGNHLPLRITGIRSFGEYSEYLRSMSAEYRSRNLTEQALGTEKGEFSVPGFCFVCDQRVSFSVDYSYGFQNEEGRLLPNWREHLVCPGCRLNNRMRAAIHVFHEMCRPQPDCALYITEQTTPMYNWLKESFSNVVGSEFLGSSHSRGAINARGVRNEDLTSLSFADGQFDFVLSFDVFEHVQNYRKAFRECRRVLKKGGVLFFTVPFDAHSAGNITRAEVQPDGTMTHLMTPEYHGDPLQESGCLCLRYFGWECLDELKSEGFTEAACYFYWSREYGYLGGDQLLFISKT